jgi:prevent-host-death family protein
MRSVSAQHAKNNFGELIDLARAAPVAVTKYDRAVVVVLSIEEYRKLRVRTGHAMSGQERTHRTQSKAKSSALSVRSLSQRTSRPQKAIRGNKTQKEKHD